MHDLVTFTITMPIGALFDEHIAALKSARDTQMRLGNVPAAHVLHTTIVLAEAGSLAFATSVNPPTIFP